jgi:hypothetical protein
MAHSLGRFFLSTSHLALSVSQCGMPRSCVVAAMYWVSTDSMQPYYVHLLILVAPRREHRLVAWKHPPRCSELTGSNVLVQHLLEDPPYPIAPWQTFSGAQHYYRSKISLSVRGDFRAHDLGRFCIITKVVHHPIPLILEAFLTIQALHRLPLVEKGNIRVLQQCCPSARSSRLRGKKKVCSYEGQLRRL